MIKTVNGIAYTVLSRDQDPESEGIRVGPPPFETVDWAKFFYDSAEKHNVFTEDDAFRGDRLMRVVRDVKMKLTSLYKGEAEEMEG